jgi:hypothetical protein
MGSAVSVADVPLSQNKTASACLYPEIERHRAYGRFYNYEAVDYTPNNFTLKEDCFSFIFLKSLVPFLGAFAK